VSLEYLPGHLAYAIKTSKRIIDFLSQNCISTPIHNYSLLIFAFWLTTQIP